MASLARIGLYSQLLLGCASTVHLARPAELEIVIHDCSGLNPRTIGKGVSELRAVLLFAKPNVDVAGCQDQANLASAESSTDLRPLELWILRDPAKKPKDSRRQPLGYSVVRDRGGHGVIFGQTVLSQANAGNVPWSLLFAYAAAHEIGHLVLGPSHSETGLMKPNWDRKDLQAMYRNSVHFSGEQKRSIVAYSGMSREIEMAQKR